MLLGPRKTAAGIRRVAIPPHLLPEVAEHLDSFVVPEPDALVFAADSGGSYLRRSNFARSARRPALTPFGVDLHFHDLRHAGLTWTAAGLMHRAGHASPAAALRYQHATADRDAALVRALSEMASRTNRARSTRSPESLLT